jgi:hemoglobin
MNLNITTEYDGKMPDVTKPNSEILRTLGEDGIRNMISQHYDLLVQSEIKDIFPEKNSKALEFAKQKSADFFIQIMGGQNYYTQNRGNPMLKKRHMPFPINMEARIVWLKNYREVITQLQLPDSLKLSLWNYLDKFSLWMMNS